MNQPSLVELTRAVMSHRDERDWAQFHTPRELAISLCVEAAELLALMQWKQGKQLEETLTAKDGKLRDELADVLHSLLLLANNLKIDLGTALPEKLKKDAAKYPVHKAKGKSSKYNEL